MLARLRHRRWDWVAFGAAWLLVAQLMLGGFMQGAAAAPAVVAGDSFLGIICSSGGASPEALPNSAPHTKLPNCCVLGCAGLSIAALPPPTGSAAHARAAEAATHYDAAAPILSRDDRVGVRARGPPLRPV